MDGVGSDEARRPPTALLRSPPPEHALRWVAESVDASDVVRCDPMPGGSSSALHRLTLRTRTDELSTVVVRRYVLDSYLESEPDAPSAEVTALRLASQLSVPTPGVLAADLHATRCDAPAIVMRELDGRPWWAMAPRDLRSLVDALAEIHAVDIRGVDIRHIDRYHQRSFEPPRWVSNRSVWERAIEIFQGPIPEHDVGFAHRDFHPGNVLWRRRRITGIVDWQAACRAPVSIDISHCRLNLAFYDASLPEVLRVSWERRTGRTFDPWADVMSIVGALDHLRDTPPGSNGRTTIDGMLSTAVAALTR
jgi:aminoglycoside phosphotransferase (APT) family kinase protein